MRPRSHSRPTVSWAGAALALFCGGLAPAAATQETARVWVNPRSNVYHCPGTEHYGKTNRGRYLDEDEAQRQGYRPKAGRPCGAPAAWDSAVASMRLPPRPSLLEGAPRAPGAELPTCVVIAVTDGDGIECRGLGRVRLVGIDAPELDQHPFGAAAAAALSALAPVGTSVQLEAGIERRDRYGRLLAYLWLDDRMVNWVLARQGWAVALRYPPNTRYADAFQQAERAASRERLGLWMADGFRCRPADHRRERC